MSRRTITLLLLTLMLAACAGSPKPRYYVIDPVVTEGPAIRSAEGGTPPAVEILDLRLARHLDRATLVSRIDPHEVHYLLGNEWAAPLRQQLGQALAERLAARLGSEDVAAPRQYASGDATLRLLVDVDRFERDAARHAVLNARWQVFEVARGRSLGVYRAALRSAEPLASEDPRELVAELSALFAGFGDQVTASLPWTAAP